MANLLNWSGLSIQRKKDENTPLITSLRTLNPTPTRASNTNAVSSVNSVNNNANNNQNPMRNALAQAQQINEQIRQREEQRRQEEERRRQEEAARKQQEEARRAQEQQARQQKQQQLLNSISSTSPAGAKMASSIQNSLDLGNKINALQPKAQQDAIEKQRQMNETETNRLANTYQNQINQNKSLLNSLRSGETKLPSNAFNKLSYDAFKNNLGQSEPKLSLSNNLGEKTVENQVKGDEDILQRIRNGSRPITLGQGLGVAGDELSQAAGNAILGEQTEDESFGKQILRAILNIPGSVIGEPMRLPGLLQDAGNPNGTKNVLEKNSDGTATVNVKENGALNRLGSAADAAIIPISMFSGGITPAITKAAVKGLGVSTLKNTAKQLLKTGAEEAAQEAGQNLAQELSDQGKWDEGTLGRTGQAAALGGITGGLVSGAISGAGNIKNAIRGNQNTEITTDTGESVQTTQNGDMVKANPDGTITRLSDAELANVIEQGGAAQTNINPFRENNLGLRPSSEDVNTLTRQAKQGNTYAQQRLAELTQQNQNENTGWRGQSVDEVINQENQANAIQGENTPNEATLTQQRQTNQEQEQNALQSASNELDGRIFSELTPIEQEAWLEQHSDQVMSETQLAQALRAMDIDPTGMSRLDMLRAYSRALDNPTVEVRTGEEIGNTPEVMQSEREVAQDQTQPVQVNPENLAQEPAIPTRTDTTGANEGAVNASMRVPTVEELSVTPPEAVAGIVRTNTGYTAQDLIKQAEEQRDQFINDVREITIENGVTPNEEFFKTAVKNNVDRINQKIMEKNGKTPTDMLRSMILVKDPNAALPGILKSFEDRGYKIWNNDLTNRYTDGSAGYKDIAIKFTKGDGDKVVKEFQIMSPHMYEAKFELGGHKLYEEWRVKKDSAEAKEIEKIVKQMDKLYAWANKLDAAELNSSSDTSRPSLSALSMPNGKPVEVYPTMSSPSSTILTGVPSTIKNSGSLSNAPSNLVNIDNSPFTPIVAQNGENVNTSSSFARNTSANPNFSDQTRRALKNNPVGYNPVTNEERLARANEILGTKSTDEIDTYLRDNFFNAKDKDRNSGDVVLAGEYAKMLDAKGQYDRATEVINKMSEIATKQGQEIQALSVMFNRSPEGIANMAQTAIKKSGGNVDGKIRQQIVENTQAIGKIRGERATLAQENAAISEQIMNGQGDLKTLRKRQMEIAQAYRQNLDQEGRQFAQLTDTVSKNSPDNRSIFGAVWRASLLSGPRTHTGNAVSNLFQNTLNASADRIAAGLDWARAKATGTERQVVTSAGGRGKGTKRGLKAAGEVLKTGNNLWAGMDTMANKTNAWGQNGELEFKNKIANNMVAKPTNFVFRAMSAGDLPFRYAAFENAIRTEAKRQGVNQGLKGQALEDYINSRVATPDPELQAYGMRKGNEAVYDVDTKLSGIMNRIDKFIEGQDNKVIRSALRGTKTIIAPFIKVPSKVLSTAIDYSPLGSVKAIVNKIGTKGYTTAQFETDLAKSGLGTAGLVGLGYALSAAGLLTGGYPDSQDERNRWKAEGIEPNSIKIGDKYVSLNYLGPASMLMSMGSGVQQRQAKGEDALTIASGTIMDTLNTFMDQSYVQGLNSALQAITDSNRYGESYTNSLARGLVPNLLRQTATATDPMQRQVDDAGDAVVSGIPGLSQTLNAKVDTYGQEIKNKQTLPLGQMWDALKISNSREANDVIDEVKRLHEVDPANKDLQVTPPKEDNTLSVKGTNVKITDDQKLQLQKDTGAAALKAMRQVMQSEQYAEMSDTEKAKALDEARSNAQTEARKQFIAANNITASNNPETTESGGGVDGDFSSNATNSSNKRNIKVSESLANEYKDVLNKYNSMSSDDWDKYIYGDSAESAAAEYKLAKAKYKNDLANGKLNDAQKIKREKELAKLKVSQEWTKNYRDAYSLAGTKSDMQAYLNNLDDDTRAQTVAVLNGLNKAMYEAGIIQASTYKTRYNAINNTTSKKSGGRKSSRSSGMSSAEASALSSLAKTMAKNTNAAKAATPKAPDTKRKLTRTRSGGNKTSLASYTPEGGKKVTVTKGTKKSTA
ncbi:MAG: hypothetical protein K6G49_02025 [Candidatus Saccharibacteria bacterium]|nr:hypothetical protein [Candidatus Saccharibacteria bacterium]